MESDLALLERFLAGDEEAFTEIVERYQKKIYFFVLRIVRDAEDARDISQKAFIQAFKGASDFEGRSSFKTWLFKIAVNLSRNHLRDNQSYETVDVHSMDIAIPIGKNQLDILCEEERARLLERHIQGLPEKQRETLYLRIYGDLSFQEISEVMECPVGTAKANYHHAVCNLRDKLRITSDE